MAEIFITVLVLILGSKLYDFVKRSVEEDVNKMIEESTEVARKVSWTKSFFLKRPTPEVLILRKRNGDELTDPYFLTKDGSGKEFIFKNIISKNDAINIYKFDLSNEKVENTTSTSKDKENGKEVKFIPM